MISIDEMAMQLAKGLAEQKDGLIRQAISRKLGHDLWVLESTLPRMRILMDRTGKIETYTLDDKPILEIHPPSYEERGGKMQVDFKYKFL